MRLPGKLQGKTWHTYKGDIDSAFLERVLDAIAAGRERCTAIADRPVHGNTDRRIDRATQLLRKAGLIRFSRGRWWIVSQTEAM